MSEKPTRHYAQENIAIAIGVALVILAIGLKIGGNIEISSLMNLAFICIAIVGASLITAGIIDKR